MVIVFREPFAQKFLVCKIQFPLTTVFLNVSHNFCVLEQQFDFDILVIICQF